MEAVLANARQAVAPPTVKFSETEAHAAWEQWGMNCGPGALCGLLGLRPEDVRPHMGDFESKRYTNPTLMYAALRSLGVDYTLTIDRTNGAVPKNPGRIGLEFPDFGLARIQWAGPWTRPGVPMRARYRMTHWVASWKHQTRGFAIFDVNAGVCTDLKSW